MKGLPQHACNSCAELLQRITDLKHELSRVKRLDPAAIADELNVLQVQCGALEALGREAQAFVSALAVPPFPERPLQPTPPNLLEFYQR